MEYIDLRSDTVTLTHSCHAGKPWRTLILGDDCLWRGSNSE
jgi:hypothetical protein